MAVLSVKPGVGLVPIWEKMPPAALRKIGYEAAAPIACQVTSTLVVDVAVALTTRGVVSAMVKLALERSKNGEVAHSTRMRAVLVVTFGTVMACVPSLGVLARSVVGKVTP